MQRVSYVSHQSAPADRLHWVTIPNFVDTEIFRPIRNADERAACRQEFDIPEDAFVIGTVAAVKKHHKRIDYLVREFADFGPWTLDNGRWTMDTETRNSKLETHQSHFPHPFLLIAGARTTETDALVKMADALDGGRIKIMCDVPREKMPDLYRAMDVFVLTSLFEMMPIALLEAMASGLPSVVNKHPVLQWIVGDGGACIDMERDESLSGFLANMGSGWLRDGGWQARTRAEQQFAKRVIVERYIEYYQTIICS